MHLDRTRFVARVAFVALALAMAPHARAWTPEGVPVHESPSFDHTVRIAVDDLGFAFVGWTTMHPQVNPGDPPVNASGVRRLQPDGRPSPSWPAAGLSLPLYDLAIESDGAGGVYVAGFKEIPPVEGLVPLAEARLYHFDARSRPAPGWSADGMLLSPAGSVTASTPPTLARDLLGVYVGWAEQGSTRLRVQHLSFLGRPLWRDGGVVLAAAEGVRGQLELLPTGGGVIGAWVDMRSGEADIYAARLDAFGLPVRGWPAGGLPVCAAAGDQGGQQLAPDGRGGVYLVWEDRRAAADLGDADVYGAHLDASGGVVAGWPADGAPLGRAGRVQQGASIAPDGRGGAWVAWTDRRPGTRVSDIYLQHVLPGTPAEYGEGGRVLVGEPEIQETPQLEADGRGGFVATWNDLRSGLVMSTVYVLRCDASGMPRPGWGPTGLPVSTRGSHQVSHDLAVDRFGRARVAWLDRTVGDPPQSHTWANRVPFSPAAASAAVTEESDGPGLVPGEAYGESGVPDAGGHVTLPAEFALRSLGATGASVVFRLPSAGEVTVDLFDASGRRVAGEPARFYGPGEHTVGFDRSGLARGVYFARVQHPGGQASAKVLVLR